MTVTRMLNVQICLDPSTAPVQMDILGMERIVPVCSIQHFFSIIHFLFLLICLACIIQISHYPQILMSVSLTFMTVMRMLNVSTSLDLIIVPALMDSLEMEIIALVNNEHLSSLMKIMATQH